MKLLYSLPIGWSVGHCGFVASGFSAENFARANFESKSDACSAVLQIALFRIESKRLGSELLTDTSTATLGFLGSEQRVVLSSRIEIPTDR